MRSSVMRIALSLTLASFGGMANAQANKDGFVDLFNGKDLSGWKLVGSKLSDWTVDGNTVTAKSTARGWLMSEAQYDDFELRFEYRVAARANSGVTFRATTEGNLSDNNVEIQILDDAGYQDLRPTQYTGSLYNVVPRSRRVTKATGEWNDMRIVVKGRQLTITLNDTQVVDADLDDYKELAAQKPGLTRAKGHIGLQSWDGAIDFRNVRIKTAPAVPTTMPGVAAKPVLVLNPQGHTDSMPTVLFTPDGKQLISISKDKSARIWNVQTGEMVRTLRLPAGAGRAGNLYAGAVSPDGKTLVLGGIGLQPGEASIFALSLATSQIERTLSGHRNVIEALAFSADGRHLASGSDDGDARIWDLRSGQNEFVLSHRGVVRGLAFSPDGKRLATASTDGSGRIWSAETGKLEATLSLERDGKLYTGNSVAWSADGKTVAVGCGDGFVRLFTPDGKPGTRLGSFGDAVISLAFVGESRDLLVVTGFDQNPVCELVNADSGKTRVRFTKHTTSAWGGAISPDGTLAATGGFEGNELYLWKTSDGSVVRKMGGEGRTTWSVGWSPDGKTLAWGNSGKRHYSNAQYPLERTFQFEELYFGGKPTNDFLRGQASRGGLTLQRKPGKNVGVMEGPNQVATLTTPSFPVAFALLPGDRAVVAHIAGMSLFDARSGRELRAFQGHTGDVWAVAPSPDDRYILSASSDQTVRVWAPDRTEPLLSLFVAGGEWITWTPEGYYAASPGGEKLMGWQVNNGPTKLATFHPAAQFRKTFYRPDVIKRLLEAGSVEKALALADKERGGQKTVQTEVARVLPPKVAITFPEQTGQKITSTTFEVKSSAASVGEHPVTSLRLLVDGRPYGGEASLRTVRSAKVGDVKESWSVELPPGPHRLAVVAGSAVSQSVSDEIEVLVSPTTGNTKPPTSNLHLLSVGINAYPGRMKLDCAVPDAKAIDQTFRTHSKGVYQIDSTLLLDKEATRANILKGIADLEKKAKPGDVVVMFYAGHGDCKIAGEFVMVSIDATLTKDKLLQTAVSGNEVKERLAKLPCTVLLIMDCCYAGSFDAPGKKKRALPTETGDLVRELVNDDHGLVVMCGASKEQESGEESKLGHGYFTQSLIEGLGGKAVSKRDGVVYLSGLQNYVEERVRELSSDEQYPTIGKPTLIRSFPLSKP